MNNNISSIRTQYNQNANNSSSRAHSENGFQRPQTLYATLTDRNQQNRGNQRFQSQNTNSNGFQMANFNNGNNYYYNHFPTESGTPNQNSFKGSMHKGNFKDGANFSPIYKQRAHINHSDLSNNFQQEKTSFTPRFQDLSQNRRDQYNSSSNGQFQGNVHYPQTQYSAPQIDIQSMKMEIDQLRVVKSQAMGLLIDQQINIDNLIKVFQQDTLSQLADLNTNVTSTQPEDLLRSNQTQTAEKTFDSNLEKNQAIQKVHQVFNKVFVFLRDNYVDDNEEVQQQRQFADRSPQKMQDQTNRVDVNRSGRATKILNLSQKTITDSAYKESKEALFPPYSKFEENKHDFMAKQKEQGQEIKQEEGEGTPRFKKSSFVVRKGNNFEKTNQDFEKESQQCFEFLSDSNEEEEEEQFNPKESQKKTRIKRKYKKAKKTKAISKILKNTGRVGKTIQLRGKRFAKTDDPFQCTICGEVFQSGWALGGHASRVHPGQSDSYRRKIETREKRELERWILNQAKKRHDLEFGVNAKLNRVKIRKFKKEIRREIAISQLSGHGKHK